MRLAALIFAFLPVALGAGTPYEFKPVQVHGGGYVTAVIFHPTQNGLAYARTDMGGVYRWNNADASWIPLTDFLNRDQADFMGNLALALDPNDAARVYVMGGKYTQSWAGNGALLRSIDQGATWTIHNLPYKVGGNEDGRGAGERLAVDPNLGSILFSGSNNSAFYRSVNYGAAWTAVASFPAVNITFVSFDKASGTLGAATPTLYVGVNATTNNLYRSTDAGATWALVPGQPTGNIPMRAAWGNGGRLYITYSNALGPNGITGGAMHRLDTGTGTWTNLNPPAGQGGWSAVGVYPGATDQVAIATMDRWWPADEVYRSTNNGGAWTARLTGAVMDEAQAPWTASGTPHWISDISVDPFNADHVFWVGGYGVYRSVNFTAATPTWSFRNKGIEQTVPLQLASPPSGAALLSAMGDVDGFRHDDPDTVPALRHQAERGTNRGIAFAEALPNKWVRIHDASPYGSYSLDGGSTWTGFAAFPAGSTGGGTRSIALSADGASIVWCPQGGACSRSVNNGANWTAVSGGLPAGLELMADRVNPLKFYAIRPMDAGGTQVWRSLDGGASWAMTVSNLPTLFSWTYAEASLKAALGQEGELWVTTGPGGLWRSSDSGATFTKLANVTAAYEVSTGKALGAGYPALYLFGTVAGVRGFYRSDDTGASWTRLNDDQHQYGYVHDFSGDPRIYGRLYLCAEGRGILYGDIPAAGSPTPTATPSGTRTGTPTATRSPSATATRTASPSASPSRTATPSATATGSMTVSPSRTAPPSGTPSASPTASRTATPTGTVSVTPSDTPSATPSFTEVPVGSSPTDTPTGTPSFSVSPTSTETESPSPSETSSPSATATETPSATATVTETPTATATVTGTSTLTGSPTPTSTPTASATATELPTGSITDSPTMPPSPTRSATTTPSFSMTPTPSATPSPTLSFSSTQTPAASPSGTPTATPTLTPGAATATPAGQGSLRILDAVPFPQPNPIELRVRLDGDAQQLWVDRYSPALVLLDRIQVGPLSAGWNRVPLPSAWHKASGLSYVRLSARRDGLSSPEVRPLRLVHLP